MANRCVADSAHTHLFCLALAAALAGVGIGMVFVGSAAIYALKQDSVAILGIVWCFDVVFFWLLLVISIVGILLGLDVRDPVRRSTLEAWGVHAHSVATPLTEDQTNYRLTLWDSQYCVTSKVFGGRKQSCESVFVDEATRVLGSAAANFTAGTAIRDIFSDCSYAKRGVACVAASTDDGDTSACNAASTAADCAALDASAQCFWETERPPPNRAQACVPAPDCSTGLSLAAACDDCNHKCKEDLIADVKKNLHPASIAVFAGLLFCVIAALLNDSMISNDEFDGAISASTRL